MMIMGSHTTVFAVLITLTASVWMAVGVTQTYLLLLQLLVYCYTIEHPSCGEGIWMRIGFFDMTKAFSECPSPLQMFLQNNKKYCRRQYPGCTSVYFDSLSQQYTEVCGMVEGYQYGHMDAFSTSLTSINSAHLDGISITRGSPRQHIWSYAVGEVAYSSLFSPRSDVCPCTRYGTTATVPRFIGSDYYCSTGATSGTVTTSNVFPTPLWRNFGLPAHLAPLAVTIPTNLGSRRSSHNLSTKMWRCAGVGVSLQVMKPQPLLVWSSTSVWAKV